jgi:hypothetical protein
MSKERRYAFHAAILTFARTRGKESLAGLLHYTRCVPSSLARFRSKVPSGK